jgi:hypothetical protein
MHDGKAYQEFELFPLKLLQVHRQWLNTKKSQKNAGAYKISSQPHANFKNVERAIDIFIYLPVFI